jgi:signal transduction histidine kinase
MRLRQRLLGLFALFAVVPLLAIGSLGYARALGSLEALLTSRTAVQADHLARVLRDRIDALHSDIALLSGNQETQEVLAALARGDSAAARQRSPTLQRYLETLWPAMQASYHRIEIHDTADRIVAELGAAPSPENRPAAALELPALIRPILPPAGGPAIGRLTLHPRLAELTRGVAFDDRFGERGRNLLMDRSRGLLAAGSGALEAAGLPPLPGDSGTAAQRVSFAAGGERWIAAAVHFPDPPWTLVSAASLDEFAGPFLRQRVLDLVMLLGVVVLVSLAFFFLLRRATRSLELLTAAAERVGRGDLAPPLPPAASDEVGRLTTAFGTMAARIREMLAQVEAGRQTAALGRFAVELAHEIRNPLTAIKLNLQGLARDGRSGRLPAESSAAVDLSLREIQRLDQALRTALSLGRPALPPRDYAVHAVLDEALALLAPEAAARRVRLEVRPRAVRDAARGDPEAMKGVFVNLVLNAIQAVAPADGAVTASTADGRLPDGTPAIAISIRDDGPGIPAELRERIFHPFFTTKEGGTGLGLSVALQTVQALGGTLRLAEADGRGAEVVVTLPLGASGGAA